MKKMTNVEIRHPVTTEGFLWFVTNVTNDALMNLKLSCPKRRIDTLVKSITILKITPDTSNMGLLLLLSAA